MPTLQVDNTSPALTRIIHVDKRNGCVEIEREEAESVILLCVSYAHAREIILNLGQERWQATLEVSPQIYNSLHKEFSIKNF